MTDTFALSISLGNAAMDDPDAIADALERTAQRVRGGTDAGTIMDANGNAVGAFACQPADAPLPQAI